MFFLTLIDFECALPLSFTTKAIKKNEMNFSLELNEWQSIKN